MQVINCDKLAHELYEEGTVIATNIAATFGYHIMQDGVIDRKKLGTIVFADKVGPSSFTMIEEYSLFSIHSIGTQFK